MKNGIDAKAAEWVAREDRGALAAEDVAERDAWLAEDRRHLGAYARMRTIMAHSDRLYRGQGAAPAHAKEFAVAPTRRTHRRWIGRVSALAAVLALGLGMGIQAWNAGVHGTRVGEIDRLALEDGSVITLNTDSRVRVSFDAHGRNIELLRGEAMFDVAKDKSRPFVVTAGGTSVTAVGTSFLVRRAQEEVGVLVREGVVSVRKDRDAPRKLVANDRMLMPKQARVVVDRVDDAQVGRELAWREGMIAFNGETMEEVAREFARYSDIRIRIDDPAVARRRVVGLFSATDPIGFSRAVAQGMHFDVAVSDHEVAIRAQDAQAHR